jgi:hypothetical protein
MATHQMSITVWDFTMVASNGNFENISQETNPGKGAQI